MPNGTVSGCFLLIALVVDATLPLRWLYKVGSLDTMDVDTNASLGAAQCMNALVDIIHTFRACWSIAVTIAAALGVLIAIAHQHLRYWN